MPRERPRPHLRELGITARTRKSYRKAIANFFRHLAANAVAIPNSLEDLDVLLADFINECWLEGEPHGYAGHLLSGFGRFYPPCKHAMPTAWQYFNNWQRQIAPCRAAPLPPQVMTAMASAAVQVDRYDLAAALFIGFVCLLRTNELLMVRKRHCKFYPVTGVGIVALTDTKTSARKRATESVSFKDPILCRLLGSAFEGKDDEDFLYAPRGPVFRREFRRLLQEFGLQGKFHPYSLRRGGATWHFHAGKSIDATIVRGRWQHHKTARIYLEDAVATEVGLTLPPDTVRELNDANQLWATWLSEWKFGS